MSLIIPIQHNAADVKSDPNIQIFRHPCALINATTNGVDTCVTKSILAWNPDIVV